ncbi:MAG: hypothetical protein O7E56_13465 [SAR324 cluster bacterium]|nr:hypothetical protein [SAR324 cluster bacterium]MCZ6730123.1 hypothetical protein [SAR324 cluster bacterium]MCZ6842012.1 hypothetical protein [SAR324 cluster bacterium]
MTVRQVDMLEEVCVHQFQALLGSEAGDDTSENYNQEVLHGP